MIKREFVATVYIVHDEKVLLVFHKKLKKWLPPGGHIQENEIPEEAALREVKEETGIDVELISDKLPKLSNIVEPLMRPELVQLEYIQQDNDAHQHIDLFYLAVPRTHDIALSDEAEDIRWFSLEEMEGTVPENIRHAAKLMIQKVKNTTK